MCGFGGSVCRESCFARGGKAVGDFSDDFDAVFFKFVQKEAGFGVVGAAVEAAHCTRCHIQFVFCPRNTDIKKAAFFFQFFAGFIAAGKDAFFKAGDNDAREFQALGVVQSDERYRIFFAGGFFGRLKGTVKFNMVEKG